MKISMITMALGYFLTAIAHANDKRLNILVIVADDMGYSDISPFGGEIPTPNLQYLAEQGIRMSQYYTSPMSAPARSMLMTGNSNHQAGIGGLWWYQNTVRQPGYEMHLSHRVITMAEHFKTNGYATMMAGKWHLGYQPYSAPHNRGFERSFALMGGGASHFDDEIPLGNEEKFHTFHTINGTSTKLAPDFYSSQAYANQLIEWINTTPDSQPIFAYLAFTAPHDPLQAPDEWINKFNNWYEDGYEPTYQQRIRSLKQLGLLPTNIILPNLQLSEQWQSLTEQEKRYNAKTMQVYAAMIANMDEQIGNVLQSLQNTARLNNTLVLFLSDNGANPSNNSVYSAKPEFWQQFDNSYTNLGKKNSFISYGPQWANVSNAPYANHHKATSAQGGINTAFIISAPKLTKKGNIDHSLFSVYDIAPTLYEFAGIKNTSTNMHPGSTLPIQGMSFKSYFSGETHKAPQSSFIMEVHNQVSYIQDNWKLRRLVKRSEYAELAPWELFNLQDDPLELSDLAKTYPTKLFTLIHHYQLYANNHLIIEAHGKKIRYRGFEPLIDQYINKDN